jgi:hypothetical protein
MSRQAVTVETPVSALSDGDDNHFIICVITIVIHFIPKRSPDAG